MSFQLVYGDHELVLPLSFEGHVEDRLLRVLGRPEDVRESRLRDQLASRLVEAITSLLEADVLPPTEKQIRYAVAVARELGLHLPAEVLQDRTAMTTFLQQNTEAFRLRRRKAA